MRFIAALSTVLAVSYATIATPVPPPSGHDTNTYTRPAANKSPSEKLATASGDFFGVCIFVGNAFSPPERLNRGAPPPEPLSGPLKIYDIYRVAMICFVSELVKKVLEEQDNLVIYNQIRNVMFMWHKFMLDSKYTEDCKENPGLLVRRFVAMMAIGVPGLWNIEKWAIVANSMRPAKLSGKEFKLTRDLLTPQYLGLYLWWTQLNPSLQAEEAFKREFTTIFEARQ